MLVILISACVSQNEADNTDSKVNNYEVIHTFKDEKDSLFANVYAHSVENNIYDSIVITDLDSNFDDFIYEIKWNKLSNRDGLDLVGSSDFYGYDLKFEKDFFRIVMLDSNKEYTSDELTISWKKEKNQFEILKY
ncbi:MAG: hypothetical protein COA32_09935 [Fluviicola sp.]|nr:MAG: hypothetical protein COA32_09935 [Fluviicola sp.]